MLQLGAPAVGAEFLHVKAQKLKVSIAVEHLRWTKLNPEIHPIVVIVVQSPEASILVHLQLFSRLRPKGISYLTIKE